MKIRDSDTDIGRYVLKRVQIFGKFSELPQLRSPRSIEWKNVEGDRPLLGKGAFSNVYRIKLTGDDQVYALKRLNSVMPAHDKKFKTGASDLALEVKLLECLDHPNIIQLHGVKSGDLEDSINHRDYFLVLDYLICSLDDRLRRWRKESGGIVQKFNKRISRKRLVDRVETTALGVAKGMEYLHAKNIVFRDLKPDNVGFAVDNSIKIFDFGLARDLSCVNRSGETLGFTGTPRYMANEIGEGKQYGLKVDVYSFGILLWQICTLKDPFEDMYHINQYHQWIVQEGRRPDLRLVKNEELRDLISQCWDACPEIRPTFTQICQRLEAHGSHHATERPSLSKNVTTDHTKPSRSCRFWGSHSAGLKDTASSRGSSMFDLSSRAGTSPSFSIRKL